MHSGNENVHAGPSSIASAITSRVAATISSIPLFAPGVEQFFPVERGQNVGGGQVASMSVLAPCGMNEGRVFSVKRRLSPMRLNHAMFKTALLHEA